jgi:hypothetical protein
MLWVHVDGIAVALILHFPTHAISAGRALLQKPLAPYLCAESLHTAMILCLPEAQFSDQATTILQHVSPQRFTQVIWM